METALIKLLSGNPEPWQIALGIMLLLLVVFPRLVSLRDSWVSYRQNRGQTKSEKEALELLKLRYEVEALRKMHDLPNIDPVKSTQVLESGEKVERQPSRIWLLIVKWPIVGGIFLRLLQLFSGVYALAFGLGSLAIPFIFFFGEYFGLEKEFELTPGKKNEPLLMVVLWLTYLAFTYLMYKAYKICQTWVKELRLDEAAGETVRGQ